MPELSEAVGVGNETVTDVEVPKVGDTAMWGQERDGAALSVMITGNVQRAKFPALSVALHVTEVEVETLKRLVPESGHDTDLIPDSSRATTLVTKPTVTSGRASVAKVS